MNIIRILQKRGYYVFRNGTDESLLSRGREHINSRVDYREAEKLISEGIMQPIQDATGLNLTVSKYRVSNNNNSVDAAGFHRDLQVLNRRIVTPVPVYTALMYLDDSMMEVIPGSHTRYRMTLGGALRSLRKRTKIDMKGGDVLIFHASLIHRGIFYKKAANRRLIQCFDCIPQEDFEFYNSKILHLPCLNNCNSRFEYAAVAIAKVRPFINLINNVNYFNVATGYSSSSDLIRTVGYRGIEFLSTEANNRRLAPRYDGPEVNNRYIVAVPNLRDQRSEDVLKIYYHTMVKFFVYKLTLLILGVLAVYLCYRCMKLCTHHPSGSSSV